MRGKIDYLKEIDSIKKDTETITKNQSEIKNTTSENLKNALEGINSKLGEAEVKLTI